MTNTLYIGDPAYSSWSLRGWLLFERFGLERQTVWVDFANRDVAAQLAAIAPARTVPAVVTDEGAVLGESLAIAEELASRFPEAGIWPEAPKARALARALACEMHAGFGALRSACPMALRVAYDGFVPSEEVLADLARLDLIWSHARETLGVEGPWLCGDYSAADAFYAPVAARIATYGLPVSEASAAYVAAHLADPAFRRWRGMGFAKGEDLPWYAKDLPKREWPGPAPLAAEAVADGPSVNEACPYSGKPVTHFMQAGGKVWGFCNAFCRDKTVPDPLAWPKFAALYEAH
ncbi:MAG: glutathione S-transferase [Vannielia sp.]|uniref:glutathione S-transferase n=1 Tax=Vannielia sp. TaxID=2813045 RepID=UPI003B8D9296